MNAADVGQGAEPGLPDGSTRAVYAPTALLEGGSIPDGIWFALHPLRSIRMRPISRFEPQFAEASHVIVFQRPNGTLARIPSWPRDSAAKMVNVLMTDAQNCPGVERVLEAVVHRGLPGALDQGI
ncbi:hypothetical protein [Pseudorhodoferax sp. Leaf267]|uniref:hypothetical protein n=1 Tax=Pseudorhodoferax sp. Leaf267 TaxID=1736316 RepID=UPI0006FB647B|nr:hypothetical protein [Pseudorhodoferax sp. Leaf267]KQP22121.1 hypothetical protein ASF43_25140 [Pseudorhodoferax sp. Leaf267]